ncbi:STAS domain-containing protein [Dyella psychrodurans]|uniref:STAS domain-containing protein n=1 Tax=Dyella psychrodurans TaxID=1927960 RepID=A0A370X2C7_9GAMM|nr:STAS domain-containing protein [Dyella psychrodurans]RDS82564.1 STAS domain-containing protein [Dyella psychrodurans]
MSPNRSAKGDFQITSGTPDTVSVSGVLNFGNAAKAVVALKAAFEGGDRHVLDLSEVTGCDSAGLACVLAALSAADCRGRHVSTRHVPESMRSLAQVCGVESLLQ